MKRSNGLWAVMAAISICLVKPSWAIDTSTAPAVTNPSSTAAEIPSGSVEVVRLVLCQDVKDRDPGQEITTANVGDVVVGWTQIRSGIGDVTVTHRWLHEEENMGDVPLDIKASPWRTWSRKTVSEAGNWKFQVLDPQGNVLKETSFTVAEAAAAPAAPATPAPAGQQ